MGAINAPMVRAARVSVVRIIVVSGYEPTGPWALAGVSPIDLGLSCGIESLLLVDATQKVRQYLSLVVRLMPTSRLTTRERK